MYVILLVDLLLAPAAFASLIVSSIARGMSQRGRIARILSTCTALACVVPAGAGVLGLVAGNVMAEKASLAVSPEDAAEMLQRGYEVALLPLKFGGGSALLFLLLAGLAFFMAPRGDGEVDPVEQDEQGEDITA